MIIREMTLADVPQAVAIERQSFSQPWSEKSFADAVRDHNALFLAALETAGNSCGDEREAVLGYIGMYLSPPEGEITNVAVFEPFRGGGVGGALVAAMQREAGARGINEIYLEVRVSNASAIRLYTRAGFLEVGVRRGFYELPREDAKIMKWSRN